MLSLNNTLKIVERKMETKLRMYTGKVQIISVFRLLFGVLQ